MSIELNRKLHQVMGRDWHAAEALPTPNYCGDISHAFEVVNWLRTLGWRLVLMDAVVAAGASDRFSATFVHDTRRVHFKPHSDFRAFGDTHSLAICLAAADVIEFGDVTNKAEA